MPRATSCCEVTHTCRFLSVVNSMRCGMLVLLVSVLCATQSIRHHSNKSRWPQTHHRQFWLRGWRRLCILSVYRCFRMQGAGSKSPCLDMDTHACWLQIRPTPSRLDAANRTASVHANSRSMPCVRTSERLDRRRRQRKRCLMPLRRSCKPTRPLETSIW